MLHIPIALITCLLLCCSCSIKNKEVIMENSYIYDLEGQRLSAIMYYLNNYGTKIRNLVPLVIINNGSDIKNYEYSYLAKELANLGFYVISLEHKVPNVKPSVPKYALYKMRKPLWSQGSRNILSVLENLRIQKKNIDFNNITLIGHSHGGNIVMYFAQNYPELIKNAISLDNILMPIPRIHKPRILTIRSNDLIPMDGVLPTNADLKKFNIKVVKIPNAKHMDYCDRGNIEIKKITNQIIIEFIK